MLRWLIVALGALLLGPASAGAAQASMPYSDEFMAIAYGHGHVLVAEPEPFGANAVVIRDLRVSDHSDHVLLEIPYAEAEAPDVELVANGAGYLVALGGERIRVIQGGYDGTQRTLLDCAPARRTRLLMAAGTESFALAGMPCGREGAVTVAADGSLTPAGTEQPADGLAYAEPFLALRSGDATTVRDVTTGTERRVAAGEAASIAVANDGTLLSITTDGLFAWPPGATEPALLSKRASAGDVAVANDRVVFDTLSAPRVVGLEGGTAHTISTPGAGLASLLGFDGASAAFQSFSCEGARQVTVVGLDEPRGDGRVSECPVRIAANGLRFPRSGRATIRVSCPNGCRAGLRLVEQSTERRPCDALDDTGRNICRTIATARLNLPAAPARRRVDFALTRTGRRLRGRTLDVITTTRGNFGLTLHGWISRVVL
jgi:hypothetical protein